MSFYSYLAFKSFLGHCSLLLPVWKREHPQSHDHDRLSGLDYSSSSAIEVVTFSCKFDLFDLPPETKVNLSSP